MLTRQRVWHTAGATFNNVLQESRTYNERGQPGEIKIAKTSGGATLLKLDFGWDSGTPNNNGNLRSQTITRPGVSFLQSYSYDALNRLKTATETGGWSRTYDYDASGNRWVSANSGVPLASFTPTAPTYFNSQNRLTNGTFDSAGHQLSQGAFSYTWDAEGRMAASTNSGTVTYTYDGNGARVRKVNGAETTTYVYDAMGRLAAEYTTAPKPAGLQLLSVDHLGSTRLVTDALGNEVERRDYLPFGEQIPAGVNARSGAYAADSGVRQSFTGKERDRELASSADASGLDYFGARYFSAAQGRFTSPDPKQFSLRTVANPQKWNQYAYVLNNPLAYIDPDGREEVKVVYRAFIPSATATVAGMTFRGDNRTFSTAPVASSRIAISLTVETDPRVRSNPLIGKPQVVVGATERLSPFAKTETATQGLPTAAVSRDPSTGAVLINIRANAKNPLGPLPSFVEPGIKPNLTLSIPTDASSATVTGQTSGFPAQEVNATVGGATTPLFQFSPGSSSPMELFKTIRVNETRPLPQCSTDADGKKQCN